MKAVLHFRDGSTVNTQLPTPMSYVKWRKPADFSAVLRCDLEYERSAHLLHPRYVQPPSFHEVMRPKLDNIVDLQLVDQDMYGTLIYREVVWV
jgi:hypothetical protein